MKSGDIVKFGDMPWGTWFKESRAKNARVFIKLQNTLPSGIRVVYDSFEISSIPEGKDARYAITGVCCTKLHLNVVDENGTPGSCPDWVEFEIIEYCHTFPYDSKRWSFCCCGESAIRI